MGRYTRLGKNAALVFIGSIGSKLMSLLMLPLYTRWLTTADYGCVDLITTYSGLVLGIISCSIYDSIFLFPKDKKRSEQSAYLSSGLAFSLLSILVVGLICFAIRTIGPQYHWSGFVYDYLWFIFATLSVHYMQQLTQQFLRSIDKIVVYSITGIVTTLCIIIFSFLFIPKGGVKGYVLAIILANIVTIIYSFVHGKIWKYVSIKSVNGNSLKEMLQYSIPLIPNGIMWFLISSFNRPVLESSVGLAAVGLFAVAGRIPNMLNTLYLLFQNAWIISAVEEFHKESYKEFFNRMLKFVVIVQSVFAAILALSAKWIITVFTTEEYYSAWQYIPLLVVGVIFMNGASFVGTNFAVTKKSKFYFYSTVWSGLSSVVFNIMLIPPYGLWGACWAMLISQAVCLIFRIIYSWHIVKITNLWFYLLNIALLFIVSIGCVYISSTTQKILFISAIILCFFAVNAKMIYSLLCTIKVRIKQV